MKFLSDFKKKAFERADSVQYFFQDELNKNRPKIKKFILDKIVDIIFSASLFFDEERPTRFRCLFVDSKNLDEKLSDFRSHFYYYSLTPQLPFEAKTISKVSHGLDFETSILVISQSTNQPNQICIMGVLYTGSEISDFQMHKIGDSKCLPENYIFWTAAPGKIGISFGDQLLIALDKNEITDHELSLYNSDVFQKCFESVFQPIVKLIKAETGKALKPSEISCHLWAPYIKIIDSICSGILRHKHGGTLIILNPSEKSDDLNFKNFVNEESGQVWDDFQEMLISKMKLLHCKPSEEEASSFRDTIKVGLERIRDFPAFSSNLSKVDGAVVISKKFKVIGFGAEIKTKVKKEKDVFSLGPKGEIGDKIDIEHFGTRHRSAIRFVNKHSNAIVFVFSQDGGEKVIFQRNGKIIFGKDLNKIRHGLYWGL